MINYTQRYGVLIFHSLWNFFGAFKIRAFKAGFVGAVAAGVLTWGIAYYHENISEKLLKRFNPGDTLWGKVTVLLCFLLVFNTKNANERFDKATGKLAGMQENFFQASAIMMALSGITRRETQEIATFRHTFIRLFSLLNLLCFAELAGDEVVERACTLEEDCIDMKGLDSATLEAVKESECKPELVFQQIQLLLIDNIGNGPLQIVKGNWHGHALLGRIFHTMGVAMKNFETALTLARVQVPFPYLIITEVVMLGHFAVTPFQMVIWTQGPWGAAVWSFILTFIIQTMYSVASELNAPFGDSKIAFDLVDMNAAYNSALAGLLHHAWATPAHRSPDTIQDTNRLCRDHEEPQVEDTWASGPRLRFYINSIGRQPSRADELEAEY